MDDITYIEKRLKEIFSSIYDNVSIIRETHERSYSLIITLHGVSYKRKRFEIDKDIKSVGNIINYICKEI